MQKVIRRIATMVVVLCLLLVMAVPAIAAQSDTVKTENAAVLADDKGVVQVLYVYTDDNGDQYLLSMGTGFFINETNIVTCNHVVSMDSEFEQEAAEELGITVKQLRERLSVQIAVYRDSTPIPADILSTSTSMDYAVLTLKNPMNNKVPLKVRSSAEVKKTETVYTIGYPGVVDGIKVVNDRNGEDSTINRGEVVSTDDMVNNGQAIECIVSDNVVTEGNSGGPLVDNDGSVVGICAMTADNKYTYSIAIDQVVKDLDARGVAYEVADGTTPEPEIETEPVVDEPSDTSVTEPESEAVKAPSYGDTKTDDTVDANSGDDGDASKASGLMSEKTLPLIIIVVVVVVIIIVLLLIMSKKKNNTPKPPVPAGGQGMSPKPPVPPMSGGQVPNTTYDGSPETGVLGSAGETTLLGQGSNETTVLSHTQNYGTLTRKKTGESITINKDNFKIGKERSKVDYCVSDNTAVSRLHAIIVHRNGSAFVVDQNSKNFTMVNDVRASANVEVPIKNGDKITFADEDYTYRMS